MGLPFHTREKRPSTADSAETPWLRRKAAPKRPPSLRLTLQVQQALARKGAELVASERHKMELAGEQASLKMQLRKTLWAKAGSWREALPKS